ncbi:GATA transcription factor 4-like [Durio zibethinus]|uniref:GATA transcription factor 4-like n=1 Tax=Durio zibethinus TaxID=66656 RepID=A0A6P5ZHB4_DURZI|nr:GATA transcription factor 4-like [Durio zibethinus]
MAVEDLSTCNNNENNNISLPVPTNEGFSGSESQLCVPQDSLEDIDWFPDFTDEIISLDGFSLTPEHESFSSASANSYEVPELKTPENEQTIAFTNKKQRGKREGKRGYWSIKQEMDSTTIPDNKLEAVVDVAEWNPYVRRKCSHCLAENTPQWRMGPLGPKTLCNACGVRYKSGRLVPEYRPAASPTFDTMKHSNFHKKILRRRALSG